MVEITRRYLIACVLIALLIVGVAFAIVYFQDKGVLGFTSTTTRTCSIQSEQEVLSNGSVIDTTTYTGSFFLPPNNSQISFRVNNTFWYINYQC